MYKITEQTRLYHARSAKTLSQVRAIIKEAKLEAQVRYSPSGKGVRPGDLEFECCPSVADFLRRFSCFEYFLCVEA